MNVSHRLRMQRAFLVAMGVPACIVAAGCSPKAPRSAETRAGAPPDDRTSRTDEPLSGRGATSGDRVPRAVCQRDEVREVRCDLTPASQCPAKLGPQWPPDTASFAFDRRATEEMVGQRRNGLPEG